MGTLASSRLIRARRLRVAPRSAMFAIVSLSVYNDNVLKSVKEAHMVAAPINLISLDERGIAYIASTKMKVAQIARERVDLGYTPEDIVDSHSHLSLAQVHAALSYYYCHQAEIDAFLRDSDEYVEDFFRHKEHVTSREELEARRLWAKINPANSSPVRCQCAAIASMSSS